MTPETIRIISQLRREFYSLFAAAMKMPVNITSGSSSTGNPPMASWIDDKQRLNYLRIFVYTAPDQLIPERPFILRLSLNKGGGVATATKWRREHQGLNQDWCFELTLLPEEILDFLPWLVSLVKSHDRGSATFIKEPPHPLYLKIPDQPLSDDTWTESAYQAIHNSEFNLLSKGDTVLQSSNLSGIQPMYQTECVPVADR